jgi:acyl-CoA reductase-like NAD-dependent aldehyde dehydrogenase
MGSVISLRHLERVEDMIKCRRSGNIVTGGERMVDNSALDGFDFSQGSFFPPTIIQDIDIEDELWREEIFGPVVVTKRFLVSDLVKVDVT